MSLPNPEHPCWGRLIDSQLPQFKTRQAALMFLLKKVQNPSEPPQQRKKALYDFFVKYQRVLDAEIAQLTH